MIYFYKYTCAVLEKTYVSHLGEWTIFALLLWVALLRKRFDHAKLLVILSDGSDWIRSLAAWLPMRLGVRALEKMEF